MANIRYVPPAELELFKKYLQSLERAQPSIQRPVSKVGNSVLMPAQRGFSFRLLDIPDDGNPLPWVLTVQGSIPGLQPIANLNNPTLAVVKITMGAGGATIQLEASAFPGFCLELPSAAVTVDVFYDPSESVANGNPANAIRVSAMLRHGFTSSSARRVINFATSQAVADADPNFYFGGDMAGGDMRGIVPAFAKSFRMLGTASQAIFDPTPANSILVFEPPGGNQEIYGSALRQSILDGTSFPIPGGVRQWRFSVSAASAGRAGIDFEIKV